MTGADKPSPLDAMLRDLTPLEATEALRRLQVLVASAPNLRAIQPDNGHPRETLRWLGELSAVVSAMKLNSEELSLKFARDQLLRTHGSQGWSQIEALLYEALAKAELNAPASEQGAFVTAGNQLDAYAAITKVLASAESNLLLIDPYWDGKSISDFLPGASEGVHLRVLADEASVKPTLAPTVERWIAQFGSSRPIEVRITPSRLLHDRLVIVDQKDVWLLTQSFKDFANRSHGSLVKANQETAHLKVHAYEQMWSEAKPI